MCRVLQVSRSGYYAWKIRPVSLQATQRTELVSAIHVIHADREMHAYGSPRIYRELLKRGYEVCENTVAKLMSSEGIASSTRRNFVYRRRIHDILLPVAENILDRDFTAEGPGQKVVSDLTYIATGGRISVSGVHDRCVFAACDRLVDEP
jgi:putative transposase